MDFTADDNTFMASFVDIDGDVSGIYFSLSGALLPANDGQTAFATLTYELTSELSPGDVINLHVSDVVCADAEAEEVSSAGIDGSISSGSISGDVNGDGAVNIQDIIIIANMLLNGDYSAVADVNGDGSINVQDIVLIVNMILDN